MGDEGHGGLQQNVEVTCNDLAGEKIDEVLKYIKNTQENSEDIFEANNDVIKNRIDSLVFQYICRIAKENIMTNITLNYT